jgi:hypothetical protein
MFHDMFHADIHGMFVYVCFTMCLFHYMFVYESGLRRVPGQQKCLCITVVVFTVLSMFVYSKRYLNEPPRFQDMFHDMFVY